MNIENLAIKRRQGPRLEPINRRNSHARMMKAQEEMIRQQAYMRQAHIMMQMNDYKEHQRHQQTINTQIQENYRKTKIDSILNNMNRWQKFKHDRAEVLDRYLKLKKRNMRGRENFTQVLTHKILKKMQENINKVKQLKEMRMKQFFLTIKISFLFHRKINQRGPNLKIILSQRMRNLNTFFAASKMEVTTMRAKKCIAFAIKQHFINKAVFKEFKRKLTISMARIKNIKRIMINQIRLRRAKEEVMITCWEKLVDWLDLNMQMQRSPD